MAKTIAESVAETTPDLTAKVRKAVDAIKKPFTTYVKDFAALAASRETLAPMFMKACGLWQAETAGTFVDFVRFLVPEIPATRAEYRSHRAFQAADYLRRLQGNAARRPRTTAERATAPAPPTDAISRLLAALVPIIPDSQQANLWNALKTELHWTDRQVQRIQTQVEHVDPLFEIRGRSLDTFKVTIPAHDEESRRAA